VARRTTWLIDMGDGTWAVSCMACRIALYRGSKAGADRPERGPARAPVRRRDPGPALDGRAAHRQPHPS
jgi:hypothetical protein